jgi:quinoprotein glucose dehydrogenase
MNKKLLSGLGLFLSAVAVWSCVKIAGKSNGIRVIRAGEDNAAYAEQIENETAVRLADGLKIKIWATDSLAPDPVAMAIDDFNRIYLTRTNRQKNSEFDIRGHRNWMTDAVALQSVEDRRAFLRRIFASENSAENQWLKDLNGDGLHDWRDLAVEQDEIWRLEDTDGDGLADASTQVLKDFNDEITDVAGALLIRRHDAFVGIGPDLWRIEDTNKDGYYDKKTSIAHGFNVHISFSGHGMSGLVEGPDGKIYWNVGDPGMSLVDQTGKKHHYPNEGVIVRCNPDGSDFEVFSHGHRNTHEFVFDQYGNMISSDNDGDHPGESERLVHLVEGSDSGWRINWQFGKYTDPKNNRYKVWMNENMYKPRHEGQAAYFIPPIRNYHNGPTGMLYNPGTALSRQWKNKFFLVEFTGNPSNANIWAFDLKPKGASFDFNSEVRMVNGILATGIRFGTDGAMYMADWVNGWGTKDYGRVWKLDVLKTDMESQRAETKRLMALDFAKLKSDELYNHLFNEDQRIRQKAQFELAIREDGAAQLEKATAQTNHQLARVHGIWGLGQIAAKNAEAANKLIPLLKDNDPEIIAQAAKVLGDIRYTAAGSELFRILTSENPRIRFFAIQSIGRIGYKGAVNRLLGIIDQNKDEDVYIRHAAVLALTRLEEKKTIYLLKNHASKHLRLAGVLILRNWKDPELTHYLNDSDPYIVAEAARAINDDESVPEALPALAKLVNNPKITSEVVLRRAINAALRVGGEDNLTDLLTFASRESVNDEMRAEALATAGTWAEPSPLDRVDGRFRGYVKRDAERIRNLVIPQMNRFLDSDNSAILKASTGLLTDLEIRGFNSSLVGIFEKSKDNELRGLVLSALAKLKYPEIGKLVNEALADNDRIVRTAGLALLNEVDIPANLLPQMVENVLATGSQREKQQLLESLGKMPLSKTKSIFETLIGKLQTKEIPDEIKLDLSEAITATNSGDLKEKLAAAFPKKNLMDEYTDALYGGDRRSGANFFNQNERGQCIRCHVVNGSGGTVGPDLSSIGNVLSREELLQSLVEPSARLAPGFGTVTLKLTDGQEVTGILEKESSDELVLRTSDAEPLRIAQTRISKRENYPSGMPPMASLISKREMRDVIEFLANLKR